MPRLRARLALRPSEGRQRGRGGVRVVCWRDATMLDRRDVEGTERTTDVVGDWLLAAGLAAVVVLALVALVVPALLEALRPV
jgi:hypothetical protein